MSTSAEVVVVGAGVMGLATARALAGLGRDVLVLEQFEVGHDRGSSHGSSRIFRLAYPDEELVRLALEALGLWRELESETGTQLVAVRGSLDVAGDHDGLAAALDASGVRFELLEGKDVRARFGIECGEGTALHQPDGGVVWAERALAALWRSAEARGAKVVERAKAVSLAAHGRGMRIQTADGTIDAPSVVVTAGAWARPLLATAGVDLHVTVTRETAAYFALDSVRPPPSLVDWRSPEAAERRLRREGLATYALDAGAGMLKASVHAAGPASDPDEESEPDAAVVRWVADWAARTFPRASGEPLRAETCLYTSTADERFVLERHGPLVVGSPCSGQGFKFAPAVGARLAELATGGSGTLEP